MLGHCSSEKQVSVVINWWEFSKDAIPENDLPLLDINVPLPIIREDETDLLEEVKRESCSFVAAKAQRHQQVVFPIPIYKAAEDPVLGLSDYEKPSSYIRFIEKTPSELADSIEYDMDSEDETWLATFNKGRRKAALFAVSEDDFELIIDRLEKESFQKQKQLELQNSLEGKVEQEDDAFCDVCGDDYADDTNLIVSCDGCDISVHQDCYGIVTVPEGRWLCKKCEKNIVSAVGSRSSHNFLQHISKNVLQSCVFCPGDSGAYKQTIDGRWAHVACALWIPETRMQGVCCRGPVEGIELIPPARWKLTCSLCKYKTGACVQCFERTCTVAFHVTCAKEHNLCLEIREENGSPQYVAFCNKHTPGNYKHRRKKKRKNTNNKTTLNKKRLILKKIETQVRRSAVSLSQALKLFQLPSQIVEGVFEYWLQKRQAHSGLPLLRSLKGSSSSLPTSRARGMDHKTDSEWLESLHSVRKDFEKIEFLLELVKRREKLKRELITTWEQIFELQIDPLILLERNVIRFLQHQDNCHFFHKPVSAETAPNYFDVITDPMDFETMAKKIDAAQYHSLEEFWEDIRLIFQNALKYNAPSSIYAKEAKRIGAIADELYLNISNNKISVSDLINFKEGVPMSQFSPYPRAGSMTPRNNKTRSPKTFMGHKNTKKKNKNKTKSKKKKKKNKQTKNSISRENPRNEEAVKETTSTLSTEQSSNDHCKIEIEGESEQKPTQQNKNITADQNGVEALGSPEQTVPNITLPNVSGVLPAVVPCSNHSSPEIKDNDMEKISCKNFISSCEQLSLRNSNQEIEREAVDVGIDISLKSLNQHENEAEFATKICIKRKPDTHPVNTTSKKIRITNNDSRGDSESNKQIQRSSSETKITLEPSLLQIPSQLVPLSPTTPKTTESTTSTSPMGSTLYTNLSNIPSDQNESAIELSSSENIGGKSQLSCIVQLQTDVSGEVPSFVCEPQLCTKRKRGRPPKIRCLNSVTQTEPTNQPKQKHNEELIKVMPEGLKGYSPEKNLPKRKRGRPPKDPLARTRQKTATPQRQTDQPTSADEPNKTQDSPAIRTRRRTKL